MRFDIMTLFPELVKTVLSESIIGRAQKSGAIEVYAHNIRDYSKDKHRRVDDTPYGGGMGTILELNSAQLQLTQARLNYTQAVYDYLAAQADYEQIVGMDYEVAGTEQNQ